MKISAVGLMVSFSVLLSACGPLHVGVREEETNVDIYPSSEKFLHYHTDELKQGITESELLKGIHGNGLRQVTSADEIQKILFGGTNPLANKESLPGISSWILSHHIFFLPYKNTRSEFYFSIIPISYTIEDFGPDLSVIFITKRDEEKEGSPYRLARTMVTGVEDQKIKSKEYIWTGIWNALGAIKGKLF